MLPYNINSEYQAYGGPSLPNGALDGRGQEFRGYGALAEAAGAPNHLNLIRDLRRVSNALRKVNQPSATGSLFLLLLSPQLPHPAPLIPAAVGGQDDDAVSRVLLLFFLSFSSGSLGLYSLTDDLPCPTFGSLFFSSFPSFIRSQHDVFVLLSCIVACLCPISSFASARPPMLVYFINIAYSVKLMLKEHDRDHFDVPKVVSVSALLISYQSSSQDKFFPNISFENVDLYDVPIYRCYCVRAQWYRTPTKKAYEQNKVD
eukprot:g38235.t1